MISGRLSSRREFTPVPSYGSVFVSVAPNEKKTSGTRVVRGCLHDNGATSIPGRDEKLHRVYIKPCLLGASPIVP